MDFDKCPLSLVILPHEEYNINIPKEFPVSFANWGDNVLVEIISSKTYGPYTNKKRVFGINFGEYPATIRIVAKSKASSIILGCLKDEESFKNPGGYAKPVGECLVDYNYTDYPIIYANERRTDASLLTTFFSFIGILYLVLLFLVYKTDKIDIMKFGM